MKFLSILVFLSGLAVFSAPTVVVAQKMMRAVDEIEIYAKPIEDSPVVHTLFFGDEIRVSTKTQGAYRLIQYSVSGKARRGYILSSDLPSLQSLESEGKQALAQRGRRKSVGYISLIYSYQYQGQRALQTMADDIYELSEFTGTTTFFGFGYEWPYDDVWSLRLGGLMRKLDTEGDSESTGGTNNRFNLQESFIGGELGLRYAPINWGAWSFLATIEYSKGTSVKLVVLEGSPIDGDNLEKPTFVVLSGGFLYRRWLTERWGLDAAIEMGSVVTTDPFTILTEASLSGFYSF